MLYLKLLLMCVVVFALVMSFFYLIWRQREFFSRVMDRRQLRPSQVAGGLQIGLGLICLVCVFGLPTAVVAPQIVYTVVAAIAIANGVDKLRHPPTHEYRPPWYEGTGDPNWLPATEAARNRKFAFRLSWIGTVIFVLCVALASYSVRIGKQRQQTKQHADAVLKIEQLGGTVQNKSVTLAGTNITDADLELLGNLSDILELNLGATSVTNDGVREVGHLHNLSKLNLSGTRVDDDGLVWLSKLNSLRELRLRKTNVTGKTLPIHFASARTPGLILDLSLCPITKEGLRRVAEMPRLLHVDLNETDIDDSMLDELKAIQTGSLDISRTNVSKEGSEQIRAAHSNLSLFWSARAAPTTD